MTELPATPEERLTLSRERMRAALREPPAAPGASKGAGVGASPTAWLDGLKSTPAASLLIDGLAHWWQQHPLRSVLGVVATAVSALVQPTAQKHPLGLVVGATVLGGLLAWTGAWRWIVRPAVLAGLLPLLLDKALTRMPTPWWKALLAALAQPSRRQS